MKLQAKDPADRHQTGVELLDTLEHVELVPQPEGAPQRMMMHWLNDATSIFSRQAE